MERWGKKGCRQNERKETGFEDTDLEHGGRLLARGTGDYHRGPFELWRRRHGPGRRSYACLRMGTWGKKTKRMLWASFE